MNSFIIEEIYADGYERWVKVKRSNSNVMICVHFIEYDEYLEKNIDINKRSKGDIVNGNIKIDMVTKYKIINDDRTGFVQYIGKSSSIIAFGIVKKIEDSGTIICNINNLGKDIVVEFENDIDINIGENIEINGSLELEIE